MKVSLQVVLKPLLDFITQFVGNTNNPTNVTAAQINAYTKDEIDRLLAGKLAAADVPISYWGQSDSFTITKTVTANGLQIATAVPSLLAGVKSVLAATTLAVSKVNGEKNYVYLRANNGTVSYQVSATQLAESDTTMYLGYTTGTGSSFTFTDFIACVRLGGKRLSVTRRGSAIPVSNTDGSLSW